MGRGLAPPHRIVPRAEERTSSLPGFAQAMLRQLILDRIRSGGPISFAEFMDVALYHPTAGYYARAPQRSGRHGDFYTSVDVGTMYGELLAVQVADCWEHLGRPESFDVVEAGAGNGRLLGDVLDALRAAHPDCYAAARVTAVERSAAAREAQASVLARHQRCLNAPASTLPPRIDGVLFANELLDALPVHVVVRTADGWAEVRVGCRGDRLVGVVGPAPEGVQAHMQRAGMTPPSGWQGEAGLAAVTWIHEAARALVRGFVILVDYGHEAAALSDASHAQGTLMAFRSHRARPGLAACLEAPGEQDLTAHVNLTALRHAAEDEGLSHLGTLDQTYFLLGLGAARLPDASGADTLTGIKRRLALKALVVPGGLGSTMKVMILVRGVGTPVLRGLTWPGRVS